MSTVVEREAAVEIDDDDRLYEVIKGKRVEKPVGASEVILANRLAFAINARAVPSGAGLAIVEILLDMGHPEGDQFRPDLIYVSSEKSPPDREIPPGNAWKMTPDLAVEVVSPSNTANEIQNKVDEYLAAGVRHVWVFHPGKPLVYIYDGSKTVRLVEISDTLDGGEIVPGLLIPLSTLFPGRAKNSL